MKQSHFTIIALLLMVVAFVVAAMFHDAEQEQSQNERASKYSEELERDYSPRAGDPAAKVTLVEFMDPACETCAQFHPFVKGMMQHYAGKVKLVVRYAPFHKGSDEMVAILEAARKQDRFWQVLELMFETQPQWASHHNPQPAVFWTLLEKTDVDIARLKQDMQSPAIAEVMKQDLADGKLLGASKTPTFFVNGKPLPSFGFDQLRNLVDSEVRANY
ncbi:DsbA family protein [Pseudomonadota bacterium]